ncbi:hypothetical protein [Xenorhabdus bovienii]|uniref:Uncharacterized protein n=1 Tax=Xenorhabdus bovienii str. Intermedium TaxID=1379677 RepID=A0A077QLP7_XENBV|nr:hypothetical protein [Xenorhabdus bovienii]CDH33266.1 hypothetical protein XBI1_2510031 [Xenorhabdus bovienii str. Intermedium]
MNKRNLTRAQSWGCLAVRENRYGAQDEQHKRKYTDEQITEHRELEYKREVLGWEGLSVSAQDFAGDFT